MTNVKHILDKPCRAVFCVAALVLVATCLFSAGHIGDVYAQNTPSMAIGNPNIPMSAAQREAANAAELSTDVKDGKVNPKRIPSLVFTYWEHTAILEAKKVRGFNRAPTQRELEAAARDLDLPSPDKEQREITLGGISYRSTQDWTIWLNGNRITPEAVPKEILELRVYNDYIELKWIDEYTNQIFPVKLRANERFNMDMRIFLPG